MYKTKFSNQNLAEFFFSILIFTLFTLFHTILISGVRQCKFKHWKCKTLHRSTHIENIRKLDRTVPGESNFFVANKKRCVVPIEGSGGLLSVFEVKIKSNATYMLKHLHYLREIVHLKEQNIPLG